MYIHGQSDLEAEQGRDRDNDGQEIKKERARGLDLIVQGVKCIGKGEGMLFVLREAGWGRDQIYTKLKVVKYSNAS